jgi:hypothetical protein
MQSGAGASKLSECASRAVAGERAEGASCRVHSALGHHWRNGDGGEDEGLACTIDTLSGASRKRPLPRAYPIRASGRFGSTSSFAHTFQKHTRKPPRAFLERIVVRDLHRHAQPPEGHHDTCILLFVAAEFCFILRWRNNVQLKLKGRPNQSICRAKFLQPAEADSLVSTEPWESDDQSPTEQSVTFSSRRFQLELPLITGGCAFYCFMCVDLNARMEEYR